MSKSYSLKWTFRPRLLTEHLGSHKYTSAVRALAELVANSFDAGATTVRINLVENELESLDRVEISDDGRGITADVLETRIAAVGIEPVSAEVKPFSRFGVGRLAVFSLGRSSSWTSTSRRESRSVTQLSWAWHSDDVVDGFQAHETELSAEAHTGTTISIYNLRSSSVSELTEDRIARGLLSQFCSFLIGNKARTVLINGERLDVSKLIVKEETETFKGDIEEPVNGTIRHLQLTTSIERSRFPAAVLFCANGRTVATLDIEDEALDRYLGIVECPALDKVVTSNREAVINFDATFQALSKYVRARVDAHKEKLIATAKSNFISRARQQDFYPFRSTAPSPVAQAEQAVYDVVLERIHESINLENMGKKQQAVIFRLLQRTLKNDDVLEIVSQVADLSDADAASLREVLERTTFESIIKLSSEATKRLAFLSYLHELTYGELASRVKERAHLHKIVDAHCWFFGARFHLATSDQTFRAVIRKHRELVELPEVEEATLSAVQAYTDVPDLFLAASRDYPVDPKHQHLLVELKAPRVKVGAKEVAQLRRYARILINSPQLSKESASWDLFLVSADVTEEVELERNQEHLPFACINEYKPNVRLWVFKWSELIQRARDEMQLVLEHLNQKSAELRITDYLEEHYPSVLKAITTPAPQPEAAPASA